MYYKQFTCESFSHFPPTKRLHDEKLTLPRFNRIFVIPSYLRTFYSPIKSCHCSVLSKAEAPLHPRRHCKALLWEYVSSLNRSTILICAGWEQDQEKELTIPI